MSFRRTTAAIAGVAAMGLLLSACSGGSSTNESGEETFNLTFAAWGNPGSSNEAIQERWVEMVEEASDGRITFDVASAGSLCAANEIPECVRDGRADVGQTVSDYAPQLFPQASIVSIPFVTQDSFAMNNVLYEISQEHDGAKQLWEDNNLVMIGHWPAGRLLLGSDEPTESIEDIAKLRWRMAGPYTQAAVEEVGGSTVALTAPETFEAVERGVVDASAFPIDGLVTFQLKDILPNWADPGIGQYTTIGQWMNKGTYDSLPEDLQKVIDDVNAEFNSGAVMEVFNDVTLEQCDAVLEAVGSIEMWDEAETAKWEAAVGDSLQDKWVADAEANGLTDAAGYLELYKQKLEAFNEDVPEDPSLVCAGRS